MAHRDRLRALNGRLCIYETLPVVFDVTELNFDRTVLRASAAARYGAFLGETVPAVSSADAGLEKSLVPIRRSFGLPRSRWMTICDSQAVMACADFQR